MISSMNDIYRQIGYIFFLVFCFIEGDHEIGIIPVKCVFLLLQRLFYGVSNSETNDKTTFSSKIIVNHKYEFSVKTLLSQIEAKNAASRKAVNQLCEVENKYNQHKQIDIFPDGFASSIQKYIVHSTYLIDKHFNWYYFMFQFNS